MSRIGGRLRLTHEAAGNSPAAFQGAEMTKITPFLWFDTQAEEAMNFYASIFKRSRVISVNRAQGRVISVEFELEGQRFMALNAGPQFTFNEAVSFFVGCETQQEIDELWAKLTADGGSPGRCGWLKDKFGLSWQIIPNSLGEMLGDKDPARANRAMEAMLQMNKLDISKLQRAFEGR
jgi:predicted 3-demethylubiquinone-9 3-methyltransferase (glyoxalase superfamily)